MVNAAMATVAMAISGVLSSADGSSTGSGGCGPEEVAATAVVTVPRSCRPGTVSHDTNSPVVTARAGPPSVSLRYRVIG